MVATGTGETLPGPTVLRCAGRSAASYNRVILGKWATGREGVGGGRITA